MKKLLPLLFCVLFNAAFGTTYYVGGPDASNSNAGTSPSSPFLTIQRAADVAIAGDVVLIRSGTYRETITPANSGVEFRADVGADVTISGLELVPGTWTLHSGQIWKRTQISLPVSTSLTTTLTILANQIFKDGEMQFQARWPKVSSLDDLLDRHKLRHFASMGPFGTFALTSLTDNALPDLPTPIPPANGNFSGASIFTTGWFIAQTRTINSGQSGKILNYPALLDPNDEPNGNNDGWKYRKYYYITNDMDLLTQAKEWHYENETLYFWQEGGGEPTGVEYKKRNWGFNLKGKEGTKIIELKFIGCEPATGDDNTDNTLIDHITATYMNHTFNANASDHNYFNAKQVGIKLLGSNNTIKNSKFQYASSQVIWAGKDALIENNLCSDIGYEGNYGAFVSPWHDDNTAGNIRILRNTAFRLGRSAVDFGRDGTHKKFEIAYNDFHTFSMLSMDCGAIYGCCSVNIDETRIHHNWIHDNTIDKIYDNTIGVEWRKIFLEREYPLPDIGWYDGIHTNIYFDQEAGGEVTPVIVDHNVMWNGGVADIYSQIKETETDPTGVITKMYNNVFGSTGGTGSEESRESYFCPFTTPKDIFRNNIFALAVNVGWTYTGDSIQNSIIAANPTEFTALFEGPLETGSGYRLKATSLSAIDDGQEIPPFTNNSVNAPDIGAYEYGVEAWVAGHIGQVGANPGGSSPAASPLIQLSFNEASGVQTVVNAGSLSSAFTRSATIPSSSSTNVPVTVGGANSFDFGTTPGNYYVESSAVIDGLKNLNAFTLTGWVNCKSSTAGGGGNRIISWINNGADGVDLAYQNDGSLRLGVDGWPDSSPAFSSANKVTTDASAAATNWVFFAVTYQSSNGEVQFYFGNNAQDAVLDVTKTNNQGAVGSSIGKLAIGAFNDATRNMPGRTDRMFRGLIDNIQIHSSVLTPSNIVAVQRGTGGGDVTAPTAPTSLVSPSKTDTSVSLTWAASTDNVGVTGYEIYNGATLLTTITPATSYNVTGLTPSTAYSFTVKAKDAANNLSVASNILNVSTDPSVSSPLIHLSFNEGTGVQPVNAGTASSTFLRSATTPSSSANVPVTVGGANAFDFGTTVGDYYVESTAAIDGLKNLSAFTLTGWVNCKSNTAGGGGNRIISWINNGGDGVDLAYQADGSLRLGVEGWPDSSPAFSSASKVTTNASAPATNWVFFAVTYQSSNGQVQFYFGNNAQDAVLDVTQTYNQGVVGSSIGKLAIGAFNDATRNMPGRTDRMFRGLIDNIQIHGSVLTPSNIVAVQRGTGGGDVTAPTAPTSLVSPSKTDTSVSLTWAASTDNVGVTGYDIFQGGTTLCGSSTTLSFTVTGLTANTAYSFTVKAKDAAGNISAASTATNVTTSTLPAPWQSQDIGAVGLAGSATYSGGVFTVNGSGTDIWGTSDEFHYVYRPLTGDGEIVARVISIENVDFNSKAGVMIRETLTGGSKHAIVNLAPSHFQFSWRPNTSGTMSYATGSPTSPGWVKLKRLGNVFTAYESVNGTTWTQIGTPQTITMASSVYVGLAVLAKNNAELNTSTFDNVVLYEGSGDVTAPTAPTSLVSPSKTDTSVNLTWAASTDNVGVTGYDIFRGGTTLCGSSTTLSFTVTGLTANTTYSFTVKAKDAAGNISAASTATNVTTSILPPPWQSQDIGAVGLAGSATYSGGVFTVNGSGTDIWSTSDEFHYVYRPLTGDGEMVAKVTSVENVNFNSKAGVMIRETLTGGSKHALINLAPAPQIQFNWRSSTSGTTSYAAGTNSVAPYWVKLKRVGNAITAFESSNGTTWTPVGTAQTITMASNVYIGLAVLAKNNAELNTSTFDNVVLYDGSGTPIGRSATAVPLSESIETNSITRSTNELYQNLPNPYSVDTEINLYLLESVKTARLVIYDLNGKLMKNFELDKRGDTSIYVGEHELNSGMYVYMLIADGKIVDIKRMVLTK